MSLDAFGDVNWLAVFVATLVYFGLGSVWYRPAVFGTIWQRSIGWDPGREAPRPTVGMMAPPFVAFFVMCATLGLLAKATATDTAGEGAILGLVAGIGISGGIHAVTAAFDPTRPARWAWFAVNAGYHAVGLLVAGLIVGQWT